MYSSTHRLPFVNPRRCARGVLLISLAFALIACDSGRAEREAAAAAAARAQQAEQAAEVMRGQMQKSIADGRPDLARAYAEDLISRYPDTAAGKAVAPELESLRAAADAEAETRRLQALWTYHEVDDPAAGGVVYTAFIRGDPVQRRLPPTRLVLRRHPDWGQSVYLLMDELDFACPGDCKTTLILDDAEPIDLAISRAKNNVPPAVFITKDAQFLEQMLAARTLRIHLKLADEREVDYDFDVSGFDLVRLGPPSKTK